MSLSFLSKSVLHDSPLKLAARLKLAGSYNVNLRLGKFEATEKINHVGSFPWDFESEYDCSHLFYKLTRFGSSFTCAPDKSMKFEAKITLDSDEQQAAKSKAETLDTKIIERKIFENGGTYTKISKNGLIGHLFIPELERNEQVPGIMTIGGLGGPRLYRPSLLSTHKFVTFELEYHTTNGMRIAQDPYDLDYVEAGLDFLKSVDSVDASKIGTMGISRGGEIAMSAAKWLNHDHSIKAAVGVSSPVWNSCFGPHTYQNRVVVPGSQTIANSRFLKNDRIFFKNMFLKNKDKKKLDSDKFEAIYEPSPNCFALEKFHEIMGRESLAESWLKIDEIEAETLFIFGELDKNVPGRACHEMVKSIASESVLYEKTGHIIDVPYRGGQYRGLGFCLI